METREQLATEHYLFARNFGRSLLWWDRDEGEGIALEALLESVDSFLAGRSTVTDLGVLVRLTIRSRLTDHVRATHGRQGQKAMVSHPLYLDAPVSAGLSPLSAFLEAPGGEFSEAELLLDLAAGMDLLNDQERDVIQRKLQGESIGAIALAWGRTESRVSQVWGEARKKLAPALGASFS